jgi:uncharacterized protein YjbI with pentapeptide repeats
MDIQKLQVKGANYHGADLHESDLLGAYFRDANLEGAISD